MIILANEENVFLKLFREEQQPIKDVTKKLMHHHNDHYYATMRSTETNYQKIAPRKFECNPIATEDQDPDTCSAS